MEVRRCTAEGQIEGQMAWRVLSATAAGAVLRDSGFDM